MSEDASEYDFEPPVTAAEILEAIEVDPATECEDADADADTNADVDDTDAVSVRDALELTEVAVGQLDEILEMYRSLEERVAVLERALEEERTDADAIENDRDGFH